MTKTTLYLPEEIGQAYKDMARRTGRSQASLMREALATFVAPEPRPWPRSIGTGEDAGLNAEDIEDWLAANWRPEEDWQPE